LKRVLVVGCGRMAGPIVDYLLEGCGYGVVAADRVEESARGVVRNRVGGEAVGLAVEDAADLDRVVETVDVVMSMVPRPLHGYVARSCLRKRKSLVTTSYEPPEVLALAPEAEEKGLLFLNEIGEDPGLDHLGTQMVLEEIRRDGGEVTALESYGCSLPAFAYNNNPFGYKFSWDPRALFSAGQTGAAYYRQGERIEVAGERLFEHFWLKEIDDLGTFETYPNRDCRRYLKPFGLAGDVSFYRGLLRYPGYCNTMRYLKKMGWWRSDRELDVGGRTYRQLTASLIGAGADETLEGAVARYLNLDVHADFIHRLGWLGFFDNQPIILKRGTPLDILLERMLEKMSYKPHERDMVIVHIEVEARFADGTRQRRLATLFAEGTPHGQGHSALARAVGLPAAAAARLILSGQVKAVGAHIPPTLPQLYPLLLKELASLGLVFTTKTREQ
jgi:saccharopine dehydrogenase-like NADP-dependent oxidoreductase